MDIFNNIERKAIIKSQEKDGCQIIKKRRGAPKKPNMVAKKIKVDKVLYKQVAEFCRKEGMTISYFLGTALRYHLASKANQ